MFKLFNDIFSSRSPKWDSVRKTHLKNQPNCQVCSGKNTLQVHHIKPFHVFPELELDPNNLITLCKTCHLVFGHLMDYKSWNSNVVEDAKQFSLKIKERPHYENFSQNYTTNSNNSFWKFFCWNKKT